MFVKKMKIAFVFPLTLDQRRGALYKNTKLFAVLYPINILCSSKLVTNVEASHDTASAGVRMLWCALMFTRPTNATLCTGSVMRAVCLRIGCFQSVSVPHTVNTTGS